MSEIWKKLLWLMKVYSVVLHVLSVKCLNLIDFYLLNVIKFSVNLQGRKYRKVKIFKRNI